MKKKYLDFDLEKEMIFLSNQLSPEEMFILGYLKGFDRGTMKEWIKKGIMDYSINFS